MARAAAAGRMIEGEGLEASPSVSSVISRSRPALTPPRLSARLRRPAPLPVEQIKYRVHSLPTASPC